MYIISVWNSRLRQLYAKMNFVVCTRSVVYSDRLPYYLCCGCWVCWATWLVHFSDERYYENCLIVLKSYLQEISLDVRLHTASSHSHRLQPFRSFYSGVCVIVQALGTILVNSTYVSRLTAGQLIYIKCITLNDLWVWHQLKAANVSNKKGLLAVAQCWSSCLQILPVLEQII